jgi:hypothetical protein
MARPLRGSSPDMGARSSVGARLRGGTPNAPDQQLLVRANDDHNLREDRSPPDPTTATSRARREPVPSNEIKDQLLRPAEPKKTPGGLRLPETRRVDEDPDLIAGGGDEENTLPTSIVGTRSVVAGRSDRPSR